MNTVSLAVESRFVVRYPLATSPIRQDAASEMITHTIAIFLDFLISESLFTAINLIRICGIPKYPRPHARLEMIETAETLEPSSFLKKLR